MDTVDIPLVDKVEITTLCENLSSTSVFPAKDQCNACAPVLRTLVLRRLWLSRSQNLSLLLMDSRYWYA